uniref:KOW domain-containing protein n=1 Tax=Rhabditophanes sp. KR3021 TaxID=114890 RepID=A0AC35TPB2_9BILA
MNAFNEEADKVNDIYIELLIEQKIVMKQFETDLYNDSDFNPNGEDNIEIKPNVIIGKKMNMDIHQIEQTVHGVTKENMHLPRIVVFGPFKGRHCEVIRFNERYETAEIIFRNSNKREIVKICNLEIVKSDNDLTLGTIGKFKIGANVTIGENAKFDGGKKGVVIGITKKGKRIVQFAVGDSNSFKINELFIGDSTPFYSGEESD